MKAFLTFTIILTFMSCSQKESKADKLEKEYQLIKDKNQAQIDSIDNRLRELGVNE